ncbi:MAG: preprotein translocase subunit YajC [Spirochaetaceae bacterium]|nr:MAG: preprotein translocase subunit YajC [Spirochaetaceae bacterium]
MINALLLPVLQADTGAGAFDLGAILQMVVPIGLIIVVFYFLIIRPQNKKQKELQNMINSVQKNDRVVTIGGVHATVHSVKEHTVILKVDENTTMEFTKSAIGQVLRDKIADNTDGKK